MAYSLVGNRYIGTGTMPSPVAGYQAQDTSTGILYESNTSASAWVQVGNVNQANWGQLPLSGGTMTGPIAGVSGWAPITSPDFQTSAKLGGVDLATQTYVQTQITNLQNSIASKISQATASVTSAFGIKANLAWGFGVLSYTSGNSWTNTIPLPTYPDGTTAVQSDCKWIAAPESFGVAVGLNDASNDSLTFSVDPTTNRTFSCYILNSVSGAKRDVALWYLIIGFRV